MISHPGSCGPSSSQERRSGDVSANSPLRVPARTWTPIGVSLAGYAAFVEVLVCDVGPRDGLQNEAQVLEPAVRGELVNRLAATGLRRIEAVSFVSPTWVPQMAGAEAVVEAIEARDGTEFSGLVLNE